MSGQTATAGSWQAEACPFRIEYDSGVMEQLRRAAVEAFCSLPHGGVEIGGILFGVWDGAVVRIHNFREVPCEYAFGPSYVFSSKDHARMTEVLSEAARDPGLAHLQPVGWYHTHTRSEIFLSEKDLEIYQRYFPAAWQIALVMRPAALEPTRAAFFFRARDGSVHSTSSQGEFVVAPPRRGATAPAAELTAAPLPEPASDVFQQVAQRRPPSFSGFSAVSVRRGIPGAVIAVLLTVAALLAGFADWQIRQEHARLTEEVRRLQMVNRSQAGRLLVLEQELRVRSQPR